MNPFVRLCSLTMIALAAFALGSAQAEVSRVEIASRTDVLGGKLFGAAGAYEKIVGKVFFALDPTLPANRSIVDIDKAPRDAAGRVAFSADLFALVPKKPARGNGVRCSMSPTGGARICRAISISRPRLPIRPQRPSL